MIDRWNAVRLLENTLCLSYLYQLPWLFPSTLWQVHHQNPQQPLHLLNMPRSYQYKTLNVPHCSVSSSPVRYSPSHHYAGQYISPKSFAEAIKRWDNLASVVALLQGNPVSFAEFVFLDYLCWDLQKIWQNLPNQEAIARQQLIQFFQWRSTNQVYDWMLNQWDAHQRVIPGSDHTPPDSSSNSSQRPLPIPPQLSHTPPIHIQTSPIVTESTTMSMETGFPWRGIPRRPIRRNSRKSHHHRVDQLWELIWWINQSSSGVMLQFSFPYSFSYTTDTHFTYLCLSSPWYLFYPA